MIASVGSNWVIFLLILVAGLFEPSSHIMPLSDGTNGEKEDVSPPLNWKVADDIKDVVLHQMHPSPPCVKIRCLLLYYKIPFETTKSKPEGVYKKVPVMKVSEGGSRRQINDSYIIFKNLVPVLCQQPFDEDWQNRITYHLQPSIEPVRAWPMQAPAFQDLPAPAQGGPWAWACPRLEPGG